MPLTTIENAKELAVSYQPLLLATVTFTDGTVLRLSTHPLNVAEGGYQYGGQNYYARIQTEDIEAIQALSEEGIDLIPRVSLHIADADKWVWTNYELVSGFKGAKLELRFCFWEADTANYSSNSYVKFIGICDAPSADDLTFTVTASARSPQKVILPTTRVQKRCPWIFPGTATDRQSAADNPQHPCYRCGYSPDASGSNARGNLHGGIPYTECGYTKGDCVARGMYTQDSAARATGRFGGIQWDPPNGWKGRAYISGKTEEGSNVPNDAIYGRAIPLVYGTAWIDGIITNTCGDPNATRWEVIVCDGEIGGIDKVIVNDVEVPASQAWDGSPYKVDDVLFCWAPINKGDRDGVANPAPPYDGNGDPYGNLCAIMIIVPRKLAESTSEPRIRILARSCKLRQYQAIQSVSVAGNVATVTLVGANTNIASNDANYKFSISGNSLAGINKTWTGLTSWTYGPPGTVVFNTTGVTGVGTGGMFAYTEYSNNSAWILMDLYARSGWDYDELDIQSFADAASYYAVNITYTDPNGANSTHPRYSCGLPITDFKSAGELIRGILQGCASIVTRDESTGKLRITPKKTLADQQPATVTGSNYNTPVASMHASGAFANGYVAYRFDESTILKAEKGGPSVKVSTQPISGTPNRITFPFQDSDNLFAPDSFSQVDSEDVIRAGQEVGGSIGPEGVNSYDQARRVSAGYVAELLRGNPRADTGGTIFLELESSFRVAHLQVGMLVMVSLTKYSLSDQLFRVVKVQPATNYETCKLTLQWHSDDWYTDAWGQKPDPYHSEQKHNRLARPAFPWHPYKVQPATGDPMFGRTDWTFALTPTYSTAADGKRIAKLLVTGKLPVNVFANLAAPKTALQCTTAAVGGTIPGNGWVYYVAVCAKNAAGKLSGPSSIASCAVTAAGNTNTITLSVPSWDPTAVGYSIFAGSSPHKLTWQADGGTTPSTITLTSYQERTWGLPDIEFDTLRVRVKRAKHLGVFGVAVSAVGAGTITVTGAGWTVNQWAGRACSIIAKADGTACPLLDYAVVSNTATVLTVTPDPQAASVDIGDVMIMRSTPTVAGRTLTDALWCNTLSNGGLGLAVDAEIGLYLRIIAGKGRGGYYRIADNTATSITIDRDWDIVPDATSRYIVEYPDWETAVASAPQNNSDPAGEIEVSVDVNNYIREQLLIQPIALDGGGNGFEWVDPPIREIYVFGAGEMFRTVTSNYTVLLDDQNVLVDTAAGNVTVTLLPSGVLSGRVITVVKITADANTVTVVPAGGETINGGASVTLSQQWDSYTLKSNG